MSRLPMMSPADVYMRLKLHIKACPFCASAHVAIILVKETHVSCLNPRCRADGPIVNSTDPEMGMRFAVELWNCR